MGQAYIWKFTLQFTQCIINYWCLIIGLNDLYYGFKVVSCVSNIVPYGAEKKQVDLVFLQFYDLIPSKVECNKSPWTWQDVPLSSRTLKPHSLSVHFRWRGFPSVVVPRWHRRLKRMWWHAWVRWERAGNKHKLSRGICCHFHPFFIRLGASMVCAWISAVDFCYEMKGVVNCAYVLDFYSDSRVWCSYTYMFCIEDELLFVCVCVENEYCYNLRLIYFF